MRAINIKQVDRRVRRVPDGGQFRVGLFVPLAILLLSALMVSYAVGGGQGGRPRIYVLIVGGAAAICMAWLIALACWGYLLNVGKLANLYFVNVGRSEWLIAPNPMVPRIIRLKGSWREACKVVLPARNSPPPSYWTIQVRGRWPVGVPIAGKWDLEDIELVRTDLKAIGLDIDGPR